MEDVSYWVFATLAAIAVGLGKGGVPAISAMAVPLFALAVNPIVAAGTLLPVYIASDIFGLYAYRRHFDRRVLGIMMLAMPIGVGIGWATASLVSEAAVTILVGVIGGVFALNYIFRRAADGPARPARFWPGLFWGTVSGFTSFVSHSGAPPYQVYAVPLKQEKLVFAGTVTISFAYINAIKLIPYAALGQLDIANLKISAVLAIPAILSVFLGLKLIKVVPEKLFFRLIIWGLLILSARLIYDGMTRL